MAKRKTGILAHAGALAKWGGLAAIFIAMGYAWRSYATLPLPVEGPLAGDSGAGSGDDLQRERRRAERAERELARIRGTIAEVQETATVSEATIADARIRDILDP